MRRHAVLILLACLLPGCGSMSASSLWPFGDGEHQEKDRRPANATEYRCNDGKAFYVRNLDGGAVWLIAPDRDVRLEKLADGRYGVGRVSLELSANEATLTDPPSMFVNCKRAN